MDALAAAVAMAALDPLVPERVVRRLEPELVPLLPAALGWEAVELAASEPVPEDPSAPGCALRDGEALAAAEPESWLPELDVAGEPELAEFGEPAVFGAEGVGPVGAGIGDSVSMGSAAKGAGPAGPELL